MNPYAIDPVALSRSISPVLAHFLWQGVVVAIIAWLLLLCVRRARPGIRYTLALCSLLALALAPVVTVVWLALTTPTLAVVTNSWIPPTVATDVPETVSVTAAEPTSLWYRLQPWCAAVWGVGVLMMAARLALGWWTVFRLRQKSAPAPSELMQLISRLCAALGLRRMPRIGVSRRISEAMVVGIWRPMVMLPSAWLLDLPPGVLEAVLAHELAHIRRWDPWVNAVQRVVETLLFYHPAVWWLSRRVRIEREFCCDAAAVRVTGQPVVYAQTLELVARRYVDKRVPLFASGIGDPHMTLLQRVKHVLGRSGDDRPTGWLSPLVATLLIVAGIAVYRMAIATPSPLYAQDRDGERERDERARREERERDERAQRQADERREAAEREERARQEDQGRRDERREREANERREIEMRERRERDEGGPGSEIRNHIRDLERQIEELQDQLMATRELEKARHAEEERARMAEQRAREQAAAAQHAAEEAQQQLRQRLREQERGQPPRREIREGGPERPEAPQRPRPPAELDLQLPGQPPEVRRLQIEVHEGQPPRVVARGEEPGIRDELNDIRNQVRELTEAVRNLQRTVESRGPGAAGPRGPDGMRGPDGARLPFGAGGFGGFRGFGFRGERGPESAGRPEGERGPDGERGPQGERRREGDRPPEANRRPDNPERPAPERQPQRNRRPEGDRPQGDRAPDRDRPREGDRGPATDRRPEGGERPRGDRPPEGDRPEGDRAPDRERRGRGDRRPDEDRRPDTGRREEGQSAETERTSDDALSPSGRPYLVVYKLNNVDPREVAKTLSALVPGAVVNEDPRTSSIHVFATEETQREIQQLLRNTDAIVSVDSGRENTPPGNSTPPNADQIPQRDGAPDRDRPGKEGSKVEGDRVVDDGARTAFEIDLLQEKLKAVELLQKELESVREAPEAE